jgi:hypothetical protein
MREYAFARILTQPIPAWLLLVPLLMFAVRELLSHQREVHRPDLHVDLVELHRDAIKSHGSSVATIAELAKQALSPQEEHG